MRFAESLLVIQNVYSYSVVLINR